MSRRDHFLFNVPISVLHHTVRNATAKQGYGDTEMRVSLLLDVDRLRVRSQNEYARLWGHSRGYVRNRWDGIWQDVAMWCTANGRQTDGPLGAKLRKERPEWFAWVAGEDEKPQANAKPTPSQRQAKKSAILRGKRRSQAKSKPTPSQRQAIHTNTSLIPHPFKSLFGRASARRGAHARRTRWIAKSKRLPYWLEPAMWREWVQYRKQIRKPLKNTGYQFTALDKYRKQGHDPHEVIRHSIAQGYQGLYPPRGSSNAVKRGKRRHEVDPAEAFAGISAAVDAAFDNEH